MKDNLLSHGAIMKAFVTDLKEKSIPRSDDHASKNDRFNCQIINDRLLSLAELKKVSESIRDTHSTLDSDNWGASVQADYIVNDATPCQESTFDHEKVSETTEQELEGCDNVASDVIDFLGNTRHDSGIDRFESVRDYMLNLMSRATAFVDGNPLFYEGLKYLVHNLNNTHITHLDVSGNKLSNQEIKYLENIIRDDELFSVELKINAVDCNYCNVLDQFDGRGRTKKTKLDLSHCENVRENGIDFLTHTLKENQIACLDLSNNLINCESLKIIAQCLVNTKVTNINLSCISLDPDVINYLAPALSYSQVTSIDLCYTSLNCESMKILTSYLEDTKITCINFTGNDLNSNAISYLAAVLPRTQITSIDLSHTTMNCETMSILSSALMNTKITSINLSNNNLNIDAIKYLALALPKTHITSIDLSHTTMNCSSLMLIASCLVDTKISHLNLSGNLFIFQGINHLAHCLKNTQITSIDLSKNNMNHVSLNAFSSHLIETKISCLSLSCNNLGNEGVTSLSQVLARTKITSIDLSQNCINCEGLKVLASCLIGTKINSLNLSNNKFGYDGVKHLASCLKDCEVTNLNLSNSSIKCNSLKNLILSLQDTNIKTLDLSRNNICCNNFYLASVLKYTQITKLNLSENKFGNHSPINFLLRLKTIKHSPLFRSFPDLNSKSNICSISLFNLASILKTRNISFLDLSSIMIDCDGLEYLSRGLSGSSVVSLDLSNNKINCNNVHYVARVLKHSKISSLNLSNNIISNEGFKCLVQGLLGSPVASLNLSNNQFLDDDCFQYLARNLSRTNIIELIFYGINISSTTANHLFKSFVPCKENGSCTIGFDDFVSHKRVNLFRYPGCDIEINQPSLEKGVDNLILLNKGFQKSGITKLILYDCFHSPKIPHLFGAYHGINIKEIEFKMNSIDDYITSIFERSKIGELKVNSQDLRIIGDTKLELISLNFLHMTDTNVCNQKDLMKFLRTHRTRRFHRMRGSNQSYEYEPTESYEPYVPTDKQKKILDERLDIRVYRLSGESHPNPPLHSTNHFFSEIDSFLTVNSIFYLDLSGIDMGYDELKPLPEALKSSKVISLNLSNNKIGPSAVELLAEALPYTKIVYIDLHGNDIGFSGFEYLMNVFSETSICWLSLSGNGIERVLPDHVQLSPFIVARNDNPIPFQIRYLFKELVWLNTSNNKFDFIVPKTHANPPVSLNHYAILMKYLLETPSYNIHIYDMIYMKIKIHDLNVMKEIDCFISEIEDKFINFIAENFEELKKLFGYDSFPDLVKTFEYLEFENIVRKLLLHRVFYYVNKERDILHPFIYKMLHKYELTLFNENLEPDKRVKIINYFENHLEIDGAQEIIDMLSIENMRSI
ncbi:hypothetical protein LSTR_LSTR001739 [Laodelphax striatellus]|uniref:Uncharacterized protein n=1 Tax=Laodelphax striatellus TaxID=195883 RepID=A0A482XDB4_LAOST|nr:hypothetical protein LSTR_LSTR001739 [Laodelphax striatellus]